MTSEQSRSTAATNQAVEAAWKALEDQRGRRFVTIEADDLRALLSRPSGIVSKQPAREPSDVEDRYFLVVSGDGGPTTKILIGNDALRRELSEQFFGPDGPMTPSHREEEADRWAMVSDPDEWSECYGKPLEWNERGEDYALSVIRIYDEPLLDALAQHGHELERLRDSIEAFNRTDHDQEGAAEVWRDVYLAEKRRREQAEAERDALRAALEQHGRHDRQCAMVVSGCARPCDCGLAAALAASPSAGGPETKHEA